MKILVTGGAGYIGSHTCIELLNAGYEVIVVDNLSNSKPESLERVCEITEKDLTFYQVDLLDRDALSKVFLNHDIDAVIHFAGLKAVGESVEVPLKYYFNNLTGTFILCDLMEKFGVRNLVFSSSATVYGATDQVPLHENLPLHATNPYGRTKLMTEEILRDLYAANNEWSIALLRYFNPVGAHSSGLIGEDPNGIPNNLLPYISQVAVGKLDKLNVFGNDYPTPDGTGVRDYIHVVDLARGHIKALEKQISTTGIEAYNLGTGEGYSVLEMIRAFEDASGQDVPFQIVERREGDVAISLANPSKANQLLNWSTKYGLHEMCLDAWHWQQGHPNGFKSKNTIQP